MNSVVDASASLARIGVGGTFTDIVLALPDGVAADATSALDHDVAIGIGHR